MTDEERFCNKRCCLNPCRHRCEYVSNYLDGLAEGRKVGFDEGYKKATERAYERQKDLTETYIKDGEKIQKLGEENEELKEQIEKMKNFIFEEFDICFYCPLTDTCINDEGTCPYANITEEEQKNLLSEWITK